MVCFDRSELRVSANKTGKPILQLMLNLMRQAFADHRVPTLLAVCPTSSAAVQGAVRAANKAGAPLMFAATLNQVDIDGGYTGWTQAEFISTVAKCVENQKYEGPVIVGLDHAGPGLKDRTSGKLISAAETIGDIRRSIRESVVQGYDLIYLDPTGPWRGGLRTGNGYAHLIDLTLEMVRYVEEARSFRTPQAAVSYEMGCEDSGHIPPEVFLNEFLARLRDALRADGLSGVWPTFAVGDLGTRLHTSTFDVQSSRALAEVAAQHGTALKAHNTDWVVHPEMFQTVGVACANLGPELAAVEFDALERLARLEQDIRSRGSRSQIVAAIRSTVNASGRWRKWRLPSEGRSPLRCLSESRQDWLVRSGARYVWNHPNVRSAREQLYSNLATVGINPEAEVADAICSRIEHYYRAFGLLGSLDILDRVGSRSSS